jgi:TonB family protein
VSRQSWMVVRTILIAVVTVFAVCGGVQAGQSNAASSQAQNSAQNDEIYRRAKLRVQPSYPDLARKMGISGIVKIEITVAPNGTVKDARVVGGHPVLAGAALDAAKKWRFEPASAESSGVIEFKFDTEH